MDLGLIIILLFLLRIAFYVGIIAMGVYIGKKLFNKHKEPKQKKHKEPWE